MCVIGLTIGPAWFLGEDIASTQVQRPFFIVMLLVTDFDTSEDLRESGQQLFFQFIVEFCPRFRKGIEERIENTLRECVEVLLKEDVILLLIRNRQKQPYVILSNAFLQLRLRILILALVEKLTNGKPKAIRHQSLILMQVKILRPLLNRILVAAVSASVILYFCRYSCFK